MATNTAANPYPPGLTPILPQGLVPLAPMAADKTPLHRLDDPIKARSIVVNLWQAAQERNLKNAAIQGQIDGNPPYNPQAMRRAGRSGDANFNTLEAKSLSSQAGVPYYDLFVGGNRFVECIPDLFAYQDAYTASNSAGIVAEEYDALLRRWRNFEFVMDGIIRDFIVFGKGYCKWRPNGNWRFQKIAHYRVFVPDATPVDLDELELFVVFQNWPVTFLMDAIRDEATAKAAGWDIIETRKAMQAAVPVDPSVPNDPMIAQAQLRDSDIYVAARNSTVQLASIYVKEFDGKWSELVVRRDQIPAMSQSVGTMDFLNQSGFVFKAFSRYDQVGELLIPFFFESADANWNGCSGLGRDIFAYAQLKDRTECSKMDAMFLRNSIILQPKSELDRTKAQLMQLGRITLVPPNMEVQQSAILGDITSTIEVGQSITQQIERNTGIYRPTLEKGGGNPATLGQFQTEFAQATVLSSGAINRFYSQLDRLYEEQYDRVYEMGKNAKDKDADSDKRWDAESEARRFIARCERRGVSREEIESHMGIRAFRTIGNGSSAMRQQLISTFMAPQVFPYFPQDGQQNILEDFTRTLAGQTAVTRYLPPHARLQLPTDQQWRALMENAALKEGAPVTWTPADQNLVHAQVHLQAASQAAQSLQQGADPHTVLGFIDGVGPHITQHLQHESAKPASQGAVKALGEQTKRLAGFADGLRKHLQDSAEQQQQLAQRGQQQLTEAQLEMQKLQLDTQRSNQKAAALIQLKKQRQDAELALKAQQQAGQTQLADATTAASIHQQSAKTAADIAHKNAKTAADIQHARAQTLADIAHEHAKTAVQIETQRAKASVTPSKP